MTGLLFLAICTLLFIYFTKPVKPRGQVKVDKTTEPKF